MRVPELSVAEAMLVEAEALAPGEWLRHVRLVGGAADRIAGRVDGMDAAAARAMGLLHDIGKREGKGGVRHVLEGWRFLEEAGYPDAARIALTHSFPLQDPRAFLGKWNCGKQQRRFLEDYIRAAQYDDYDRLIQLCDALTTKTGYVLLEKKMVSLALRKGGNPVERARWRAIFELREYFEQRMGVSVYALLPGIVEETFGERLPMES